MADSERGMVSDATRVAEPDEAAAGHAADRTPTEDEKTAIENESLGPGVAEHYQDMTERGVTERGEGRIP